MLQPQRDTTILEEGVRYLGLEIAPHQVEQFCRYHQELATWNRKVNLTSVTQWDRVQRIHFLDSLTVGAALPEEARLHGRLVDVGSGAGLPGLPLKIAFPHLRVTLVESVGKKARFLEHVVKALGLQDVAVCAERAETVAHRPEHRGAYDVAVARALSTLAAALEVTLPLCHEGGLVVIQKKGDIADEVHRSQRALQVLGGRLREIRPVQVPGLEDNRVLLVIDKVEPTPEAYPRRPGMPEKRPL